MGLFSAAGSPRRPFSRSYGTILPSSLAMLHPPALGFSPHPPVSVYGTGAYETIAAFLGGWPVHFATYVSLHVTPSASCIRLSPYAAYCACAGSSIPGLHSATRVPAVSAHMRYRNLRLFPIGYASLPRLRPRLPQGRPALPWNPWIFGREDSHLPLATHSGILPPCSSTAPSGTASSLQGCSPTDPCRA